MKIVVLATWHRRCNAVFHYANVLRQLGHEVITCGPWRSNEPFGERGREPDHVWSSVPLPEYFSTHGGADCDQLWLIDGGEGLRVRPAFGGKFKVVYISTEGAHMDWARGVTPYRYAEIMRAENDEDVRWLPKATSDLMVIENPLYGKREYDIVQLASARESRRVVWDALKRDAPDLHCLFGDIWGPVYMLAYQAAVATWVCSNQDFVTTRVFEAMAAGCIVFSERLPSMLALFEEGKHFIGYEPEKHSSGEGYPDPRWLAEQVRALRRDRAHADRIRTAAWSEVKEKHTYRHRVERVLADVEGDRP